MEEFITEELVSRAIAIWFLVLSIFFIVMTMILNFHWKQYGITVISLKKLRKIYIGVSLFIFLIIIVVSMIYFAI